MGGGRPSPRTRPPIRYFANFAVGLCEGPIGAVLRIWADGKPLDLSGFTMRIYTGDETQTPDPLIVAKEGDVPAYRGLAYVVFERLPLANFGNRIPQLSFEMVRPVGRLEQMVRAVTLIPGTTEFGYEPETVVQTLGPGQSAPENRHIAYAPSDVVAALDELQAVAPNLERVAIVVAWFGTDLRCGQCRVMPGVDNRHKQTYGGTWSVAGFDRATAHLVSTVDGRPAFGGTPSDHSVRDLIAELKSARAQGHALSVPDDGYSGRQYAARSVDRRSLAAGLSLARAHHLRSGARAGRLARRHAAAANADRAPSSAAAPTSGIIATSCCTTPRLRRTPAASMRS